MSLKQLSSQLVSLCVTLVVAMTGLMAVRADALRQWVIVATEAGAWPMYRDCRTAYGDPTAMIAGKARPNPQWQAENLVPVAIPWKAHAAWNPKLAIKDLQVHRLAAPSLERALAAIWAGAGRSQAEIDRVGLSSIGGGYNWRQNRGGFGLSAHAYGCAVDFDPSRNAMGDKTPYLAEDANRYVIEAFRAQGWMWGGAWPHPDGMHFQALVK